MSFPKFGWIVIGLGVAVAATLGLMKDSNASPLPPPKPNPNPKPSTEATVDEVIKAQANKSYEDQNGVLWDFYGFADGSWEATTLSASVDPSYVKVFHESDPYRVITLIKGHAALYNPDGSMKGSTPPPPKPGELPPYTPGAKCGAYACWVISDPTTATPVPPAALTGPLSVGDLVTYYLADEVDVKDAKYLVFVTAKVVGPKIESDMEPGGKYPVRIQSAALLQGSPPTQLPKIGTEVDQWRFRMIKGNLFA